MSRSLFHVFPSVPFWFRSLLYRLDGVHSLFSILGSASLASRSLSLLRHMGESPFFLFSLLCLRDPSESSSPLYLAHLRVFSILCLYWLSSHIYKLTCTVRSKKKTDSPSAHSSKSEVSHCDCATCEFTRSSLSSLPLLRSVWPSRQRYTSTKFLESLASSLEAHQPLHTSLRPESLSESTSDSFTAFSLRPSVRLSLRSLLRLSLRPLLRLSLRPPFTSRSLRSPIDLRLTHWVP